MKIKILSLIASAAFAFNANAISWQTSDYFDIDIYGDQNNGVALTSLNPTHSGMFDIVTGEDVRDRDGFDFNTETITEAEVVFLFISEQVREQIVFRVDDYVGTGFAAAFSTLNFGAGNLIVDLQQDGQFEWTVGLDDIGSGTPNNVLFGGYLAANATKVPDSGATALMLGASLFGVVALRRRRR